jgi:hypothetical protein
VPGWSDAKVNQTARDDWRTVIERLLTLEPDEDEDRAASPVALRLTVGGEEALAAFTNQLAEELNSSDLSDRLINAFAKFKTFVARFALVIHLLRWAAGEFGDAPDKGEVDEKDVRHAVRLCEYFMNHALAVYGELGHSREDQRVGALLAWMRKKELSEVAHRDIQNGRVAGVKTADDAKSLLKGAAARGFGTNRETGRKGAGVTFALNDDHCFSST